jgi:ketosteroid isomerase-like protein
MSRSLRLLLLLGLAACSIRASTEETKAELMTADRAFASATAERGVDGWVEYFAEDGRMLGSGGLVTGTDSIRAYMAPAFADEAFSLTWEPTFAEVSAGGDLGYTVGRYESRGLTDEGEETVASGWYLTVWRRQADGTWKAEMDVGSPDG